MENNETNENNKNSKKRKITIVSIILLIVLGIAGAVGYYYSTRLKIEDFTKLPEAKYPKTNKNMKMVNYATYRLSNDNPFYFSETKVCELEKDLRGYFVDNAIDIGNGCVRLFTYCKMLDAIAKDFPELSAKAKEYKNKLDSIYGPAYLQLLYCMDEFGKANIFFSEEKFKGIEEKIIKSAEKNPLSKERMPYLFGQHYTKEMALQIFNEIEVMIGNKGNYKELIHFLQYHPKTLTCDVQYILSNLCCGKTLEMEASPNKLNWTFLIPKFWDVSLPESDDPYTQLLFYSKIDNISGGVGYYNNINRQNAESDEAFLKEISGKVDFIKGMVNISNLNITRNSVITLGDKKVLLVEYSGNKKTNMFLDGRIYIFLSKYSIFAYMFNVEGLSKEYCFNSIERNIPLFDELVKACKITY